MTQPPPNPGEARAHSVRLEWTPPDDIRIYAATTVNIQRTDDGILMSIGQYAHPVLMGSPAEMVAQMQQLDSVQVHTLGRFMFNEARLRDMHRVLNQIVAGLDAMPDLSAIPDSEPQR